MPDIYTSTWMNLSGGAPLRCNVHGSDSVRLLIGEGSTTCELEFDADGMHSLAAAVSAAASEMEALYEKEEAEREKAAAASCTESVVQCAQRSEGVVQC